ncbi:hypothetical protein CPY51_07085 [Rhizobium tubonense]|uniref:Uncharacterized protein n=1 Tax=Rhizobium tubonense TaxID=484088 RepID=A0A2W4CT62_9HYPH|nr:hypothetical protein CPY51_07085 [Rhizobium tubonense]
MLTRHPNRWRVSFCFQAAADRLPKGNASLDGHNQRFWSFRGKVVYLPGPYLDRKVGVAAGEELCRKLGWLDVQSSARSPLPCDRPPSKWLNQGTNRRCLH